MQHAIPVSVALCALLAGCGGRSPASLSYGDLVGRLADMEILAVLPRPGETTALASSHDRASRYDVAHDRYIAWGANNDCCGVVARDAHTQILADIRGPGVIWRMWSAAPGPGHVRFYIDGRENPAIDLPFVDYFATARSPFQAPDLVYESARGENNDVPIPFQSSCRIVADDDWGRYYQFTYSTFPIGTFLPSFRLPLSAADRRTLADVGRRLNEAGQDFGAPEATGRAARTENVDVLVPGHTMRDVVVLDGPQAITSITASLPLPTDAEAQRRLLRTLVLAITWDDDAAEAVWSPLGDFFGDVGGAAPYRSLPVGLLADGTFYSRWYMPFARRAHVTIRNDGRSPVRVTWRITHAPLSRPVAAFGRFHAKWHRDAAEAMRPDRAPDWEIASVRGPGRFVGTHLHVWSPRSGWWGEGDDKFFVDGERFPSSFGTGTEDYFGFAWGSATVFSRPYHGQLLVDYRGHVDLNRWHIADSVPFQTSLEATIEKYFANDRPTLYAAVAYFYLAPGIADPYPAVPVAERMEYWSRPMDQ